MKIKCPVCQETIYTNPFWHNRRLSCPNCKNVLYRNPESYQPLRRILFTDILIIVFFVPLVYRMYHDLQACLFLTFFFISEWVFEIPQRTLYKGGVLRYEASIGKKSDVDSLDNNEK